MRSSGGRGTARHSEQSEESPLVTNDKEMFRSAQHDVRGVAG